ncbi:MipA/OmpV family protein [Sphingomicrobium astaxanthinifaciens]|uniref:MipA/OmpV family protein n=1 Tax=Sphingomicrobium astaxanthinifaciens TaxID=1227949 RepID=UPI001FCCAB72|nr:MipA/OmpV family protein [Sphingomicrobium astaxanthinifaciens]MCJ7421267.1 MipA/OmpV family protein [Sphingomicrobium astaxanthinifaciens]
MRTLAFLPLALLAAPAAAQVAEAPASIPEIDVPDRSITVGVGLLTGPDYEGSDDYRLIPGAAFRADLGDVELLTRGLKLYVDVIPDSEAKVSLTAGPIAGLRFGRGSGVEDEVVALLPETGTAIELGGFVGVQLKQLTNPYDTLTARIDVLHDVNGAHGSTIITPAVDFSTPLSRRAFASLGASMDLVAGDYMDTYFGVPAPSPDPVLLPAYDPEGGLKSATATLVTGYSLEGDLRKGWALFGLVSFTRLLGDAADSPLVADRGSASQWFGGGGIGYTF